MSARGHRAYGFALGLLARPFPRALRIRAATTLEAWAWAREEHQNAAGAHPEHPLGEHQAAEARAWGEGFRRAAGLL